jgi:hypothetical protein
MKEKEILRQLNKFQNVAPDDSWKKSNRELLLSQISNSQAQDVEIGWLNSLKIQLQAFNSAYQPAVAVVLILAFIVSGGTFGLKASQDTKPGDSLYIAKRISEKTQLAFTFNEEKKKQLGIEFMGNRMDELSQVLASADAESQKDEMVKTIDNLKREVSNAKNTNLAVKPEEESEEVVEEEQQEEEGGMVFTANSNKDEKGIQISESSVPEDKASSTEEIMEEEPEDMLKQAKELLEKEDYDGVILKLEEVGSSIAPEDGEVKGVSEEAETASSTEE